MLACEGLPVTALPYSKRRELLEQLDLEQPPTVQLVATSDDGAEAASAIARACAGRGITTAGLILGERLEVGAAVSALRPYARILMVTDDEDDVSEVLTALRA